MSKGGIVVSSSNVTPAFNLIDAPWIKCEFVDECGTIKTKLLSLREFFRQAHKFRGLAGETPIQDVAVTRLLLAILHAVYTRTDEYRNLREEGDLSGAVALWGRLYNRGRFEAEAIEAYLDSWYERFYLVHPERPFYQIPEAVTAEKAITMSLRKFIMTISESDNTPKMFLSRTDTNRIEFDEAARWLLNLNAADDNAGKGGVGIGWVGNIGNTMLCGDNLFETLMFNFVLYDRMREEPFWGEGLAPWELDVPRISKCANYPVPANQVELLTLLSRRMYLRVEGGAVVGCMCAGGDGFDVDSDVSVEQFARLMRKTVSSVEVKRTKSLSNPQHLWRGFASVVSLDAKGKEIKAGVLRWLDELLMAGMCGRRNVGLELTQVVYGGGSMRMKIDEVWKDTFHLNTGILSKGTQGINDEAEWLGAIKQGLTTIEDLVYAYRLFVYDMAKSRGYSYKPKDAKNMLDKAQAEVYSPLGEYFHEWLAGIDPEVDTIETKRKELVLSAGDVVAQMGKKLYTQAGGEALKGKVRGEDKKENGNAMNSVRAYDKFRYRLQKLLVEGGYANE